MATCHATWAAFFSALFSPLKGSRFSLLIACKLRLKHQQTRPPSDSGDSFHSTHKAHRCTAAVPKINLPRRNIHHHRRPPPHVGACCTERLRPLRQRFWHGCEDCIVSSLHSGEHYKYYCLPDVHIYVPHVCFGLFQLQPTAASRLFFFFSCIATRKRNNWRFRQSTQTTHKRISVYCK